MTTIANERPGTPLWTILWSALAVVAGVLLFVVQTPAWLSADPASLALPITPTMNAAMTAFVEFAGPTFRALSDILDIPMRGVRWLLGVLPWAVTFWLAIVLAWRAGGLRVALFTAATLTYMLVVGYWAESMNSLALVVVSVPSAVLVGFAFGTLAFYSPAARRPIRTMLDVLQTIPAFAYLLPILLLFGFGTVVGLIASVLFAFPPMVRNTLLGLERVPEDIVEAGRMSGATSTQLFWQVRVPAAERQLLLGVNQTTMAAFSMVIIASIIGGTADIGWEVLSKMRKAEFGESLLAGIVIALMAMVMDRITTAFVQRSGGASARTMTRPAAVPEMLWAHRGVALAVVGGALVYALSAVAPALATWPEAWEIYPASYLNSAVEALTLNYAAAIATIKQTAFFFVMLPLKIGLAQTISPFSWGFEFTPALKLGYGVLAAMISALVAWRFSLRAGAVTAFGAIVLFAGLTKLPWPITVGAFVLLAGQLGGWRLALGTALGLIFLVFAGVWPQTMLSLYLCGLAVAIASNLRPRGAQCNRSTSAR
ncbi:MAG: ABC transporter permease subunit [Pseudomonadota bacterium]